MERNKSFCGDSRRTSAPVASSTSSGVGALITATIVSNCGKAFSKAASRCRHGIFEEMSWLISVVMAKLVTAYHDDSTASSTATPMTGQTCFAQMPIARTIMAVSVFMSWAMGWAAETG